MFGNDPSGFREFLEAWYDQALFASLAKCPERRARLIEDRLTRNPEALAASLQGMGAGAQPSLWEELGAYKTPTLLLVGQEDRKFRIIAEEMSDRSEKIALEVFDGCGHNVHLENPARYTTVLKGFLKAGR